MPRRRRRILEDLLRLLAVFILAALLLASSLIVGSLRGVFLKD